MIYSRHNTPEEMIKRGIKLLLLGFIVNIGESILPYFLSSHLLNNPAMFEIYNGLMLFYVDVFAFACLTFIVMGILKKFNISNIQLLILAIILSFIGSFLRVSDINNPALSLFLGYFVPTNVIFTCFPFINWFILPVIGYIYGQYYIRCNDKSQFFKYWPIFLITSIIFFIFNVYNGGYPGSDESYSFVTTWEVIFIVMQVHGFLGLFYNLSKVLSQSINEFFTFMGKSVTRIYIVHWLYLPSIVIIVCYLLKGIVFDDFSITLIGIFILIISILTAFLFNKIKKLD